MLPVPGSRPFGHLTWEQAVEHVRADPSARQLVRDSYLSADLVENVERFRRSDEFLRTMEHVQPHLVGNGSLLEVGSGNGIGAVSFALEGIHVVATEPDPSATVGSAAIRRLHDHFRLQNLDVVECCAEDLNVRAGSFDVVYARQAMHHAAHLDRFVARCAHALRRGGLLMTVRDHVVYDPADKHRFLQQHPLQPLYGGENAFPSRDYRRAMTQAGLRVTRQFAYYDSPLNYYPLTEADVRSLQRAGNDRRRVSLRRRLGTVADLPPLFALYSAYLDSRHGPILDERSVPGRLYSYLAVKP